MRLLRCDRCSKTVPEEDDAQKRGWARVQVTDREPDLCPSCVRDLERFLSEAPTVATST